MSTKKFVPCIIFNLVQTIFCLFVLFFGLADSRSCAIMDKNPSKKLDGELKLHVPSLDELVENLEQILKKNFAYVNVSIVDCPDLTQKPFSLKAPGLGGSSRLLDVGGPGNLYPVIRKILYDLKDVCTTAKLPNGFVIGPAAGNICALGFNSELVHNVAFNDTQNKYGSYVIYNTDKSPKGYMVSQVTNETADKFLLMANILLTEGKPGKILKVEAKKRTGPENFITQIRVGLKEKYGTKPVGLGGVFLVKTGKLKMHIMPELPNEPFVDKSKIDQWLKYYNMDAPVTCTGVLVSHDPGLSLRVEHTHCFSDHGDGGHYHYDISPEDVEYEGYFTAAEWLYRIDMVPFD